MQMNGSRPNKELFLRIFEEFAENKTIPPAMQKYIDNVRNDRTSDIPDLLRVTSEDTKDLIKIILWDELQRQLEFDEAIKILQTAPRITISGDSREEFGDRFLTYCATDKNQFVKAALYEGFSIIVIKNSKGQVQIFSQVNHNMPMSDIANAITAEEIAASGKNAGQRWYYQKTAGALLNGSRTTPNQSPTTLSLEKIVEIITIVMKINSGWLPFCKRGKFACSSENCKYYPWMALECQQIRKNQLKQPIKTELKRRPELRVKKLNTQRS